MAIGNSFGLGSFKSKPTIDVDAQEFFNIASITNTTEKSALSELTNSLKNNGLWGKLDVIYPFVGGSSSSHSFNLKNTSQFQIIWNGSVTHNTSGVTGDGSTGYANTGYSIPSPQNDVHTSIHIRNNVIETQYKLAFGAYLPDATGDSIIGLRTSDANGATSFSIANQTALYTETTSKGFFSINRNGTTSSLYKGGQLFKTHSRTDSVDNPHPIYLLGGNFRDTSLLEPGDFNIAFFTAGKSLTASEQLDLYNIIQTFQTALGREN